MTRANILRLLFGVSIATGFSVVLFAGPQPATASPVRVATFEPPATSYNPCAGDRQELCNELGREGVREGPEIAKKAGEGLQHAGEAIAAFLAAVVAAVVAFGKKVRAFFTGGQSTA